MDESRKSYGKEKRLKNQRYKRKPPDKQGESASPSLAVDVDTDPQPQRANRRQRNEAATSTANNVGSSAPPVTTENKEMPEKENVTIDFSNLKRETEEIAKLTKKFSKRNISSNWHRYSAPEGGEDDRTTEGEGPADFSALIQVPASKGGHLQLKDEQEWARASESGEQLSGYFALDLKRLSHSLACVPLYQQLRLPKYMFSEEELKHFDDLAGQAIKLYNPDKIEDPNSKTSTNILGRETNLIEEPKTKNKINPRNNLSILDIHETSSNVFSTELELQIKSQSPPVDNATFSENNKTSNDQPSFDMINKIEDENFVQKNHFNLDIKKELLDTSQNNLSLSINLTENEFAKTDQKDLNGEKLSSLSTDSRNILQQESQSQSHAKPMVDQTVGNDKLVSTEVQKEISVVPSKDILPSNHSSADNNIWSEPKDKHTKSSRRVPTTSDKGNKSCNRENIVRLEDDDDDDLDFLLSLKKAVVTGGKESKSLTNKDVSSLAGSNSSPQTSSTQQHSELDDWLDTVLQD